MNRPVTDHLGKAKLTICDYHGESSIVRDGESVEIDCVSLDSVLKSFCNFSAICFIACQFFATPICPTTSARDGTLPFLIMI